jgi:uncharacterized protein
MKSFFLSLLFFATTPDFCQAQSDTSFNFRDSNGLRQGYFKIMMTGNGKTYLYAIEFYTNDKKNGMCKYFFSNGLIASESNFKNDTLHGLSKIYREYGGIRYEENFKDGRTSGFKRYYSVDGLLVEEQEFKDGIETGIYRLYSDAQRVVVESFYIAGLENGIRRVYSNNKKHELIREFDFKNGIKVGARYYKKGKLIKQEVYNYDENLEKEKKLREKNKTIDR